MVKLIVDSGATKAEWCLLMEKGKKKTFFTQGISPYFLNKDQIIDLLKKKVLPKLKNATIDEIHYYGTGCANIENATLVKTSLQAALGKINIKINHDLTAAARALCGHEKGVACILGTGSGSCFYNGKKIAKISTGLGYVLGDEGSGAFLGKKVLQHYLYNIFEEELMAKFDTKFATSKNEILEYIYKKPLPNRYMASYSMFLAENRGHYMIENIIEDGLNEFFFQHLLRINEIWKTKVHFVGAVAFGFKDVLKELCNSYGFELGSVLKNPMQGLVTYHQ